MNACSKVVSKLSVVVALIAFSFVSVSFASEQILPVRPTTQETPKPSPKKPPYRLFKNIGHLVVTSAGVLVTASGSGMTSMAFKNQNHVLGGGGALMFVLGFMTVGTTGPAVGQIEMERITPLLLVPESRDPKPQPNQPAEIAKIQVIWSSIQRDCRVFQQVSDSRLRSNMIGVSHVFDSLRSIQADDVRVNTLCGWIQQVNAKAAELKKSNQPFLAEYAEDIVGRRLSAQDQILFANLFIFAGVRPATTR